MYYFCIGSDKKYASIKVINFYSTNVLKAGSKYFEPVYYTGARIAFLQI